MLKRTKKIIKSLINITLLTFVGLLLISMYADKKNDEAIEAAKVTTIRSNVGKYVVAPHVVKITIKQNGEAIGSGTGFYLSYLGKVRIVTNKHICDQSEGEREIFIKNRKYQILDISKTQDLCIIKSDRDIGLEVAAQDVQDTDRVILVGHPRGLSLTIREGYVMESGASTFDWISEDAVNYKMISAISYPGNSGSPVTNSNGEVVGVLFAGSSMFITEGLIVPYETLIKYLSITYKL